MMKENEESRKESLEESKCAQKEELFAVIVKSTLIFPTVTYRSFALVHSDDNWTAEEVHRIRGRVRHL